MLPPRSQSRLGKQEDAAVRSLWLDQDGRDLQAREQQLREDAVEREVVAERQRQGLLHPQKQKQPGEEEEEEEVELPQQRSSDSGLVSEEGGVSGGEEEEGGGAGRRAASSGGRKKKRAVVAPVAASQNATKAKLMNLNKFVMAHTTRKVKAGWDFIDNKFQSSRTHETVLQKDASGISSPVRLKTLPLSVLTLTLCSMQVQLNQKQLVALYEGLGLDEACTATSCKIAARKLVLNTNPDPATQQLCANEVAELSARGGDPLVRVDRFKDQVFSLQPVQREEEFRVIDKERADRVGVLFEEKKLKREALQKAEARRNKAVFDFENNLGGIQYARGSLTADRLGRLQALITYCHRASIESYRQSLVTVNPAVVELLGADMFPSLGAAEEDPLAKDASPEVFQRALRQSGVHTTSKRPGSYRVALVGNPSLVNLLRSTVALGKGLYGMSNSDVVELLQCCAATLLGAVFRGYRRHWRYRAARRLWKQMFLMMKTKVFVAWRKHARHCVLLRGTCLRKFVAWKHLAARAAFRRCLFRACFWPFFVWRRCAVNSGRAREKTKFLVSRVLPTLQLLHFYRAWKQLYMHERGYNRPAVAFFRAKKLQRRCWQFGWWRYWTRRRRGLRRAWLQRGCLLRLLKIEQWVREPFQLWAAATAFKRRLRHTIKCNGHHFRRFLMPACEPQLPHHSKRIKLSLENKRKYLDEHASSENKKILNRQVSAVDNRKFNKNRACLRRALTLNDIQKKKEKKTAASDAPPPSFKVYKPQPPVNWQPNPEDFDVQPLLDEEEAEAATGASSRLGELYASFRLERHAEFYAEHDFGPGHGFEFRKVTPAMARHIDELKRRFDELETEHFLTAGFLYHRAAHHALSNLRRYAIYHRNARLSRSKYNRKLLALALDGFVRWANRGIRESLSGERGEEGEGGAGGVDVSRAEKMAFACRTERMEKLKRRRAAAQYHKNKEGMLKELERDHNVVDHVQAEERVDRHSRAQMRRLSQAYQRVCQPSEDRAAAARRSQLASAQRSIAEDEDEDEDDDKDDVVEKAPSSSSSPSRRGRDSQRSLSLSQPKPLKRQTSAEIFAAQLLTEDSAKYENVDMLQWDREERDQEMELMQQMVQYGSRMNNSAGDAALVSAKQSAAKLAGAKFRESVMEGILEYEGQRTSAAIAREFKFVSEFKVKMARNMVDVLCKVHEGVRHALLCQEKRQLFRRLRLPLLLKRSLAMRNYKKMCNWIRICRRLHAMSAKAAFFRSLKTKWCIFNRWLKKFEKDTLDATPGFIAMIRHRAALREGFSQMLKDRHFVNTCYPRCGRLKLCSHDLLALFLRWKELAQDQAVMGLLQRKVDMLHRLRVLQKVFWSLKTSVPIPASYEERQGQLSYAYVRVRQDCEQVTKRYLSRRRRSLSFSLRAFQQKSQLLLRREGASAPSFKRFVRTTIEDIAERTMLEQILLLEAFESKGELQHKDIRVRSEQPAVDGMRFCDPKPSRLAAPPCAAKEGIPAGYTLSKVKVAMQAGLGLIGLQCFWGAAGAKPIESRIRGKMFGGGISNAEFVIPPRDFLMDVECVCEGNALIGMRFKTFFQPWSRWIGSKASPLTKRHLLSANSAKLEPHDAHLQYKSGGVQEDIYPGVPQQYIVGFGGVETAARVTCLCAVVRKVTSQHVFSYSWVQSLVEEEEAPPELELELGSGSGAGSETAAAAEEEERPSSGQAPSLPLLGAAKDEVASRDELKHQMISRFQLGDDCEDDRDLDVHEHAVKEVSLSSSEEQFFDVIRMRSVEVKAAEARALKFARSLWTSMEMRMHKQLSGFTTITVLTGLAHWFLEGLCKTLVRMPLDRSLANQISDDMQRNRQEEEYNENAIRVQELNVKAKKTLAAAQSWFGRSLLSPLQRATKKAYLAELQEAVDQLQALHDASEQLQQHKEMLRVQAEKHLPHIQLTVGVMNSLDIKIKASAYKHKLLENMSLETLKNQLGGVSEGAYNFKLSDISLERIRDGKARLQGGEDQLSRILAEERGGATAAQERLRQTQQLYGSRASNEVDRDELAGELLSLWRPPSRPGDLHRPVDKALRAAGGAPERVLVSSDLTFQPSRKKTFRKSHALTPLGGLAPPRASKPPARLQRSAFASTRGAFAGTRWQSQSLPAGAMPGTTPPEQQELDHELDLASSVASSQHISAHSAQLPRLGLGGKDKDAVKVVISLNRLNKV